MPPTQVSNLLSVFKKERLGLIYIVSLLVVIAVIIQLTSYYQQKSEFEHMQAQGRDLMRILARTPVQQILQTDRPSMLEALTESQVDANFAYVQLTDAAGQPLFERTALGVAIPPPAGHGLPSSWLEERDVVLFEGEKQALEFSHALMQDGKPAGSVRFGYFHPEFDLSLDQLPVMASFALPIFLLAPLFHFLLQIEFQPLRRIDRQLDDLTSKNFGQVDLLGAGVDDNVANRLNQFMDTVTERFEQMKAEHAGLETATKLDTYKRLRLEAVLQSMPDGVLVLDETGAPSLATEKLGHMLGVGVDDIINKPPRQWSRDPEVVDFLARHGGKSGGNGQSADFQTAANPEKTVTISSFPLFEQKTPRRKIGMVVVFRDTTAEKLARDTSSDFVAHVSHELKSPLNVLAMNSEMLQGAAGEEEALRIEASNVIHDEVERLALMINNILNITKIETGSLGIARQRVKLHDLLVDLFEACNRGGNEKQLTFQANIPKGLSAAAIDKNLMRVAVNNLLTNAIKYSDDNGKVTLTAEETEKTVCISVRDEGIGISEEDKEHIFAKFRRGETDDVRARAGHGLGLALAREIVLLHEGTLTFTSELGSGSEFTIEISKETNLLKKVG